MMNVENINDKFEEGKNKNTKKLYNFNSEILYRIKMKIPRQRRQSP